MSVRPGIPAAKAGGANKRIAWAPWLETGISFVDSDHRVLVRLINQTADCVGAHEESPVVGSILESLADYVAFHFGREERLMELCGFPGHAAHVDGHDRLIEEILEFQDRHRKAPAEVAPGNLLEFLMRWLVEHIVKEDFAYARFCRHDETAIGEAASIGIAGRSSAIDWSNLRVLVVEDNPNFAKLLLTLLRAGGVEDVRLAGGGLEALDRLSGRPADLVLSDLTMDDLPGDELARRIFALSPFTRVAFVSGVEESTLRRRAAVAGVDAFLEKPISAGRLFDVLSRTMQGTVKPAA
jgi:hemerythrin-like metal-binding protein